MGRGFAFQDLPAEALAGADVFKSSNASLIEGGVAGVINLRLHKPFDFEPGWTGALNTRGIYGDNTDKFSGTIGGLVSNRWEAGNGEMGALLNVSYSDINFDRPISFNCDPRSGSNGPAGGAGVILPTCVGGLNQYGDYQRPQVNAAFQWRPSDELELYADGIYTEYESRWETDFIFSDIFAAQNITNVTATDRCGRYNVDGAGFGGGTTPQDLCIGQSARFNGVPGMTSTQAKDSGTDQYLFATGARWNSGSWHLDGDVSLQRSHTENRTIIVDIGKQVSAVDVTINADKHGTTDMVGNLLGIADDFRFANSLYQDLNDAVGKQFAVAGNGAYDLDGWLSQIQFGVRYADRDSTFRAVSGGPGAPGGNRNTLVSSVNLPSNFLVRSPSSISYINGGQHWMTPNRDFLLDQTDALRAIYGAPAGDPAWNPTRNYDANEQSYSGYLQGKYQFTFGNGWELDGLLGGRLVRTDREVMGTGTITPAPTPQNPTPSAVLTPVSTDTSDNDFLPNFSARLKLSPELQLRFSAARTMARPAFEDLNPGLTYEVPINANIRPNGFGGNPNLKSQMSDAYDLTVVLLRPQQLRFGRSVLSRHQGSDHRCDRSRGDRWRDLQHHASAQRRQRAAARYRARRTDVLRLVARLLERLRRAGELHAGGQRSHDQGRSAGGQGAAGRLEVQLQRRFAIRTVGRHGAVDLYAPFRLHRNVAQHVAGAGRQWAAVQRRA